MSIAKFFSSFVNEKSGIYDASTHTFLLLDPHNNSKQLKLSEMGKERGKANLPSTDTTIPDDIEQKIVQRIKDHERQAREVYNSNLKVLLSRLKNLATQSRVNELSTIGDNADADFSLQVQQAGFDLYLSRLKVTKTEEELLAFKEEHGLKNDAVYSNSFIKSYGVIFILVLVETLFNGYFFMQKSDFGLIGGVGISSALSVLNIGLGCILGNFGFRLIRHKRASMKSAGLSICFAFLMAIFTVNLAIAHYRTLMTSTDITSASDLTEQVDHDTNDKYEPISEEPTLTKLAFHSFIKHPLAIDDMESWFLVLLGIGFSFGTAYKVYRSDDPYFRHGDFARRREQAIEDYAEKSKMLLADLQSLSDSIMVHLDESQRTISAATGEAASISASYVHWESLMNGYLCHLEEVGRILVLEYRYSNMAARTTEAPAFFKSEWKLEKTDNSQFSSEFDAEIKSIKDASAQASGIYTSVAARIKDDYAAARKTYQSINQLQPTQVKPEEFQKWLTQEIGQDGQTKLTAVA